MNKENQDASPLSHEDYSFKRSPEEVKARIEELEEQIKGHDIWIHTGGISKIPEPDARRKKDILEAKLMELGWAFGEDNQVTDGLY